MSDAIVRLRIESQEYDNKLKRATDGLTRYADECRKVGGTLSVVEQETLDYVKALGQMDTVSRTATGSLAEMKKTYTELSVQYKKLTDEEKESPFGKALAESLNQLKGRIQEAKGNLDDVNKSLTGGGGLGSALDSIAGKFGMSIKQLTGWGAALAAGKAALDVAKDAFFASESTVDEWGRTMDASKSLYEGFLTAINTGDISGYLNRIDDIVKAARTAYDELDRLGTMQRIQSPQKSAQQTENERMRMMIQTGRYIAPMDGRSNAVFNGKVMQNGDLLSAEQIRYLEQQLKGGMQKAITLITAEVKQSNKAISAFYDRQATELGLSKKEFMAGTSTMSEFDKRMAGYQQYQQWRAQHTTIDQQSGREIVTRGNPYQEYAKWGAFRVDGDRYNELLQLIVQRDQQISQAYGVQSQAYRTMNRAEGVTVRSIMNGGSGGGGASGGAGGAGNVTKEVQYAADSIAAQQALVSQLTKLWSEAGADVRNDYLTQLIEAEGVLKRMKDEAIMFRENSAGRLLERGPWQTSQQELGFVTGSYKNYRVEGISQDAFRQANDIVKNPKNDDNNKLSAELKKASGFMNGMTGGLNSVSSGLKAIGFELPKEVDDVISVVSGVGQIISGVGAIIELFGTGSQTANTIAVSANTAAITGLVTAITANTATHLIPFMAGGGIVPKAAGGYKIPGNSWSGDNIFAGHAWVNSGELILNKSSQDSLAAQLDNKDRSAAGGGMARVSGEYIYIAMNNYLRRSGKGELVTWR